MTDVITVDSPDFCPSRVSLGGDVYPTPCNGRTSESYEGGSPSGRMLTFNGPWTVRCRGVDVMQGYTHRDVSFAVIPEEQRQDLMTYRGHPCGGDGNSYYRLSITRSSTLQSTGTNYQFDVTLTKVR